MLGLMTVATLTMAALIACPLGGIVARRARVAGRALALATPDRDVRRGANLGAWLHDAEHAELGARGR